MRRGVAWSAVLGLACARTAPGGAPEPDGATGLSRSLPPASAAVKKAVAEGFPGEPPAGDWIEQVRMHRFADAARSLDALSEEARRRSGTRYVRAVVAAELGDAQRAVKELEGLEGELPLLRSEIEALRAKSALEAGPFELAARHYGQRTDWASLCHAATALERGGQLEQARAAATRALAAAQREKKRGVEAQAHARSIRARVAQKLGATAPAVEDLLWLALNAPASAHAASADETLEQLAPSRKLTARERYTRALAFADAGNVPAVERELAASAAAAGPKASSGELLHARGWALYVARRDYVKAAELLEKASASGSEHAVRDLFYAARSRSRAHQDDRAIRMYEQLAARHPKSSLAEEARFLAARLRYIQGRWTDAAKSYDRYLDRYKKGGKHLDSANYERAVSWLAAGQHDRAAKTFAELAKGARDELGSARFKQLQGVALAGGGQHARAAEAFRGVVTDYPLSFPALAASARLRAMGSPLPPPIEPAAAAAARAPVSVELPAKVTLLLRLGLDDAAEGELAQQEKQLSAVHGARADEALCEAYSQLSRASRRYRVGQRAARYSMLRRAPGADTRWLWECIYPRPYEPLVRQAESRFQLPTNFVYAIMRQESAFAPGVVSSANAVGLMQLIPPTATAVARELELSYEPVLLYSPAVNIEMGSYYLSKVLTTFGGNVALAAAAYNAGPSAVSRWLETGEQLPLDVWVARIPYTETRGYVTRVVGNLARYAYLAGGESAVPTVSLELPQGLRAAQDAY